MAKRKGTPEWTKAIELSKLTGYKVDACYSWVTGKADPFSPTSQVTKEINDLFLKACAVLNDEPRSYADIARLTGMTKQRVEQIAKKALNKIKNHKKIKEIRIEHE